MKTRIKKELSLENLNCINCLKKIEKDINNLLGVNAKMDYKNKIISFEVENDTIFAEIIKTINILLSKHFHEIVLNDNIITKKSKKKNLLIVRLGCANCALKIEREINNIDGVDSAFLNFTTQKLKLEVDDERQYPRIKNEVLGIVKKIEPNARVIDDEPIQKLNNQKTKIKFKKEIIIILLAISLFILGLIINGSFWEKFTIFMISYLIVGGKIIIQAFKNIIKGRIFDENLLMTIATAGAFAIAEFPEAVAVMLFYRVGELFQDIAVNNSRKSIGKLMDIRPDYANLIDGENIRKVNPEDVIINDVIIVKPGEKIPLDGVVIKGNSFVDTSTLTGESVLREIDVKSEVLSGFINKNGVLHILVTKNYHESTVAKILDLIENASNRKAPTENFITKFARYYTPIVVFAALLIAVVPPLLFSWATFSDWIYRALIFLVISCPCALVISIPLSFFGGIGATSKQGILVKGSNYLEALNSLDTIVFDKTGTLTKGVFKVTKINAENNYTQAEILEFAAYAEDYSNHPISASILKAYEKQVQKSKIEKYEEISGLGIKAVIMGKEVIVGNSKLMMRENIKYNTNFSIGTIVHVVVNNQYAGNIVISDEIKNDSKRAIIELRAQGIKKIIMLTGDIKAVGDLVQQTLNIDEVYCELLPHEKVEILEKLEQNKLPKSKIAFVGDGINDAPVLARVDIGIAMGGLGSDAAIEAADIVIMNDEPSKIVTAIKIAKQTRKIVWQNIIFALGVKLIVLILGALGIASMWEAVFADVGVSVLAVFNAMRILKNKNYNKRLTQTE